MSSSPSTSAKVIFAANAPAIRAAGAARAFRTLAKDHPKVVEHFLEAYFEHLLPAIGEAVKEDPDGIVAEAAFMLEGYFRRRGNWSAIERDLLEAQNSIDGMPPRIASLCAEMHSQAMFHSLDRIQELIAERERES